MAREVYQAVLDGILTGGVYALMAVGLTLIFGVLDIINIAQGVLVVLGAYLSYSLATKAHIDPFAGLLVTVPAMFAIGVVIHWAFIRRLRGSERTSMTLLVTYAVALIIEGVLYEVYGADNEELNASYTTSSMHVLGFYLPYIYIYGFILAVALVVALYALLYRTRFGRSVRATVQDKTAARLVGINVNRVAALTFGIGVGVTAVGGMFFGATNAFNPNSGYDLISRLLAIIILGGLGSIGGALAASVFMITVESVVAIWYPTWAITVFYAALVLVLLIRPTGFFGRKAVRAQDGGVIQDGAVITVGRLSSAASRRPALRAGGLLLLAVAAIAFPKVFTDPAVTNYGVFALIYITIASSWNIFSGNSGYISLGQAVFYGSGAYTMGIAARDWHVAGTMVFALLPLAAAVGAAIAVPFGLIALRVRRHTFIVITIAVFFIFQLMAFNLGSFTGGSSGLSSPFLNWPASGYNTPFYYIALACAAGSVAIAWLIRRSRFGLQLRAIRDDEDRARGLGVRAMRVKLSAFVVSGTVTAMIGAVWFFYVNQVEPQTGFDPQFDLMIVVMVFLGGYGSIAGPVLGALIIEPGTLWLKTLPQFSGGYLAEILLGAVFLVVVSFVPRGIIPTGGEWITRLWTRDRHPAIHATAMGAAVPSGPAAGQHLSLPVYVTSAQPLIKHPNYPAQTFVKRTQEVPNSLSPHSPSSSTDCGSTSSHDLPDIHANGH